MSVIFKTILFLKSYEKKTSSEIKNQLATPKKGWSVKKLYKDKASQLAKERISQGYYKNTLEKVLLLNIKHIHRALLSQTYQTKVSDEIAEMIKEVNTYLSGGNKLLLPTLNGNTTLASIFESGFFDETSHSILNTGLSAKLNKKEAKNILGIIVGLALENSNLVQANLLEILSKFKIEKNAIDGLIGIITNNLLYENEIKWLCKKVGLNGSLATGLMKLVTNHEQSDKYNVILSL